MTRNDSDEPSETSDCSPLIGEQGLTKSEDEEKWGREFLTEGLRTTIARGRLLACMYPLSDEETEVLVAAWYDALIGVVPCRYWKEVALFASRYTNPVDKFTLRQFFEAWEKFCEQGRAKGYETWR